MFRLCGGRKLTDSADSVEPVVTILIPWRPQPSRIAAFERVSEWYRSNLPGAEVRAVDSTDAVFNLSECRNVGIRGMADDAEPVVISDADTFPEVEPLLAALAAAATSGLVHLPYDEYHWLGATGTRQLADGVAPADCDFELVRGACSGVYVTTPSHLVAARRAGRAVPRLGLRRRGLVPRPPDPARRTAGAASRSRVCHAPRGREPRGRAVRRERRPHGALPGCGAMSLGRCVRWSSGMRRHVERRPESAANARDAAGGLTQRLGEGGEFRTLRPVGGEDARHPLRELRDASPCSAGAPHRTRPARGPPRRRTGRWRTAARGAARRRSSPR